jgi:hypothetical protein
MVDRKKYLFSIQNVETIVMWSHEIAEGVNKKEAS